MVDIPAFDELDRLEEQIRKLKIQYDQFFRNLRKLPPTEDRKRVEEALREMMRGKLRDNASRFRYNGIVSAYNRFQELWSRQMREREEGPINFRERQRAMQQPPEPPPPEERKPAVTRRSDDSYVKVTSASAGDAMAEIHRQVAEANKALGKASPSAEQVAALVEKQAEQLRGRYNVDAIAFRVETVDGKVKLKAKPVT
jgi:conjugal transfer/entry exclusion protein